MSTHPCLSSTTREEQQRAAVTLALDLASMSVADLSAEDVLSWVAVDVGRALRGEVVVLTLDDRDAVRATGWSQERVEVLARIQADQQAGFGVRAVRTGHRCVVPDLADEPGGVLAAHALRIGLRRSVATPLRSDRMVTGCLQVFWTAEEALSPELLADVDLVARALGALAGNAALYADSVRSVTRLSRVLDERAPVEQAKGMLAERHRIEMTEAFVLLRGYARDHRVSLAQAARRVVGRDEPLTRPTPPGRPGRRRRRQPVN